ncbi:hypothetical protein [Streptomyces sp. NPDC002913]
MHAKKLEQGLLDGLVALRHIEIRHPARWGAKSPMRIITDETGTAGADAPHVPLGGAAAAGVGAVPALADLDSPPRAPLAPFYLFTTPATALHACPPGPEQAGRPAVPADGPLVVDLPAAHTVSAPGSRSARNSVLIISIPALIIFLAARLPVIRKTRGNRKRQFHGGM